MIEVYYKDDVILFDGPIEAATWVASNESISNIYAVELAIMKSILCGIRINNYKFKIKGGC